MLIQVNDTLLLLFNDYKIWYLMITVYAGKSCYKLS